MLDKYENSESTTTELCTTMYADDTYTVHVQTVRVIYVDSTHLEPTQEGLRHPQPTLAQSHCMFRRFETEWVPMGPEC